MAEAEIAAPPSRGVILALTAGAAVVGALIVFGAVLPAEYNRDPLGIGRATGIDKLWAPAETTVAAVTGAKAAPDARSYATSFRSDVIDIPLKASGDRERGDELEYKVHLAKGSSFIYSWEVRGIADPEEFYTEFHGHTLGDKKTMVVAYYRKATGSRDNGVLTAPFDGIHGWYFQNQSEKPVTVRLRVAGFYDLIAAGQPGNEKGFTAIPVP